MPNRYYYSESADPNFSHVIRCEPDSGHTHESGKEWLLDIQKTIELLGLKKDVDYQRWAASLFAFATEEGASAFYTGASVDLGHTHRLVSV